MCIECEHGWLCALNELYVCHSNPRFHLLQIACRSAFTRTLSGPDTLMHVGTESPRQKPLSVSTCVCFLQLSSAVHCSFSTSYVMQGRVFEINSCMLYSPKQHAAFHSSILSFRKFPRCTMMHASHQDYCV